MKVMAQKGLANDDKELHNINLSPDIKVIKVRRR
jgi:hypothetical protein